MAIVYPLALPTTPTPSRMLMRSINAVAMSQSPFTFEQQVFEHQGGMWGAEISLPPMERATAEAWLSFLLKLRGRNGTFLLPPFTAKTPRGIATGSPQVDGDGQTGLTLATLGWTASQTGILKAGDYLQVMKNYITKPEEIDHADWTKNQVTVAANTQLAPDGSMTADRVTPDGGATDAFVLQNAFSLLPSVDGQQVDFSAFLKAAAGTPSIDIAISDGTGNSRQTANLTTSWQWFSVTRVLATGTTLINASAGGFSTWVIADGAVDVWGVSLTSPQDAHLHKVLNDADSDANGLATFDIWPRLRTDPKDHADIIVQTPVGLFRLARNDSEWDISTATIYGLGISAMEAI